MTYLQPDIEESVLPSLRRLKSTDPHTFRHPLDERAHQAVENLPIFPALSRTLLDIAFERSQRILHLSSSIRVSAKQFPRVYNALSVASYVLNAPSIELYITSDPAVNAYAIGQKRPMIVLTSGAVDLFSESELTFVIAHEIGHILCGHMVSHYVLENLSALLKIWTHELVDLGIELALLNVSRMAELSADRAGLLVVQDEKIALQALAQLACGSRKLAGQMNLEELARQASDFDALGNNIVDNFHKATLLAGNTHPYIVLRIRELLTWSAKGLQTHLAERINSTSVNYLD